MRSLLTRTNRKRLYVAALACLPLLVAYGAISSESAPLWADALAGILLVAAPATALGHLTPLSPETEESSP